MVRGVDEREKAIKLVIGLEKLARSLDEASTGSQIGKHCTELATSLMGFYNLTPQDLATETSSIATKAKQAAQALMDQTAAAVDQAKQTEPQQ